MRKLTRARSGLKMLTLALLAATCVLLSAPPASAHAGMTGSDPRPGQRLADEPDQVRLEFNEKIDPMFAKARIAVNGSFADASVEVASNVVTVKPPARAAQRGADARWTVAYRVVSEDGHPVVGTLKFRVAASPDAESSPSAEADPSTGAAIPSAEPSAAASPGATATEQSNGPALGQIVADGFIIVLGLSALIGTTMWVARGRRQDRAG